MREYWGKTQGQKSRIDLLVERRMFPFTETDGKPLSTGPRIDIQAKNDAAKKIP